MLVIQSAVTPPQPSQARIGLAIAGGGPTGGMFELGALRAIENALDGIDLTRLDVYVGVSSGAFLAAGLANRMRTEEMCRIFLTGEDHEIKFRPEMFLKPAFKEYARRITRTPTVVMEWARRSLKRPGRASFSELMTRLGGVIPNGVFDNSGVEEFLRKLFSVKGRLNDFRALQRDLYIVAVDLDSGKTVRFGTKGWDDVPISQAIQASAALPGLYPPVLIRGRHFVDGALRRTMHASVALEKGIDLLIGINPFVPFNARRGGASPSGLGHLADGGLPVVLSQTFRTLLQSRVQVGLEKYARQYPETDQLILEPDEHDGEMFFTNVFSYSSRLRVCEYAYRATLNDLRKRRALLEPIFARHGIHFRESVMGNPRSSIMDGLRRKATRQTETTAKLRRSLEDVETMLHRRKRNAKTSAD